MPRQFLFSEFSFGHKCVCVAVPSFIIPMLENMSYVIKAYDLDLKLRQLCTAVLTCLLAARY